MKRASKKRAAAKRRKTAKPATNPSSLRKHLAELLDGGNAHAAWRAALAGIPEAQRGAKPPGAAHTPWQLLEHLRIAQWDILEFCRNPRHVSPEFPSGYWPASEAPLDAGAWGKSLESFARDLEQMKKLVMNPRTNLFARIPHGDGQTILREALLAADHAAYHLGQMVLLRRLLGAWPES